MAVEVVVVPCVGDRLVVVVCVGFKSRKAKRDARGVRATV